MLLFFLVLDVVFGRGDVEVDFALSQKICVQIIKGAVRGMLTDERDDAGAPSSYEDPLI